MRVVFFAALLSLHVGPALAFCDEIAGLGEDDGVLALPGNGTLAECTSFLQLGGGVQTQCSWPFAYRSTAAKDAFVRLNDAVIACLGPEATITQDQSVNHPDFYDLRLYLMADQEIGVSLKDKAALQQTYVFLRTSAQD